MESTLLTAEDVARQLRIKKYTVYELIKRGELPSSRVGKQVRVSQEELDRYLRENRTGPQFEPRGRPPDSEVQSDEGPGQANVQQPNRGSFLSSGPGGPVIVSGQDRCIDLLLARIADTGGTVYRSYMGCYNGLNALYHGKVTMAASHLWDGETGEYNYPFIRRLLPGVSVGVLRLGGRMQGFYVKKGNPLKIQGWEDLARPGLVMINREKGCGTRILLDQKLKMLGINTGAIKGYTRESASHMVCASTVAKGGADLGCGCQAGAESIAGVDFIPLQLEWYDLVIRLSDRGTTATEAVISYVSSGEFKNDLEMIGGYDVSQTGVIKDF
jgi:putative molybdopterin biosynthesis protein